ncbi:hypothetical protein TRVL_10382 [Trypanosoma vivax]|nr:hypothetical protein TRVL_10382 [Trypanosoma vivax]
MQVLVQPLCLLLEEAQLLSAHRKLPRAVLVAFLDLLKFLLRRRTIGPGNGRRYRLRHHFVGTMSCDSHHMVNEHWATVSVPYDTARWATSALAAHNGDV